MNKNKVATENKLKAIAEILGVLKDTSSLKEFQTATLRAYVIAANVKV